MNEDTADRLYTPERLANHTEKELIHLLEMFEYDMHTADVVYDGKSRKGTFATAEQSHRDVTAILLARGAQRHRDTRGESARFEQDHDGRI